MGTLEAVLEHQEQLQLGASVEPAGSERQTPSPALRVWVVRHPCGPFSELEGVGDESMGELLGACLHEHGL